MQNFIHSFAISFISKLPIVYSAMYIFIKVTNLKCSKSKVTLYLSAFFGVTLLYSYIDIYNKELSLIVFYLLFVILISLLSKKNIMACLPLSITAIGISYCIRFVSLTLTGIIGYYFALEADSILTGGFVFAVNMIVTFLIMKIKRLKSGLAFFEDVNNLSIGLLISGFIIISVMFISAGNDLLDSIYPVLFIGICISCVGIAIWIKASITNHYKKRLQNKADEHFNTVIAEKDSQIAELTNSNAFLSKIVHRDNHLMASLQYSLNELSNCNDEQKQAKTISELLTLAKERNELVQKEQTENKVLASTGNSVIDGALLNMYIKASAHEIGFDLITNTDINCLINHFLTQTELETLLCDHIKDAIIAIESADIRDGKILTSISFANGIYEISINDNGIAFEPKTLQKLGLERITTHKQSGGSGIGFMTSFDTLKKSSASLIITEYDQGKPFTKTVAFRFDGQGKFIINSYRNNILKEKINRDDIIITPN